MPRRWASAALAMLFASGLGFGGGRTSFRVGSTLINVTFWGGLIFYWRTAGFLEWPAIVRLWPCVFLTQLVVTLGAAVRRGGIDWTFSDFGGSGWRRW